MRTEISRRLHADDGVGLVEILIAMVILGVVMSATAGSLIAGFAGSVKAENRTRATALANEEMENLRALRFVEVGFYGNDALPPGAPADTVLLAQSRPPATRAPRPITTVQRGAVTYTVRRDISWIDVVNGGAPVDAAQDTKRLRITVTWTEPGAPARRVVVESVRAPEPNEVNDFRLSIYDVLPGVVRLTASGAIDTSQSHPTAPLTFRAITSAPAQFVSVRWHDRNGALVTPVQLTSADGGLTWGRAGPWTSGQYPNGDVVFTFLATRSFPVTQEVLGRKLVRFLQPIALRSAVGLPYTSPCLAATDPHPELTVVVDVDGLVEEDAVSLTWQGGSLQGTPVDEASTTGTKFRIVIPAGTFSQTADVGLAATSTTSNTVISLGTHAITINRNGSPGCPNA